MLFCGFMSMFICYVIKVNCTSLFYSPVCEEFGVSRTAFTQVNTAMTATMMIGSAFIGKIYKKYPMKWVLTGCVSLAAVCYVLMSFSTAMWQLWILGAIQGIGWAGATNLPVTIMVSNWFGPKIKGTAMSIGMLGSGAGALGVDQAHQLRDLRLRLAIGIPGHGRLPGNHDPHFHFPGGQHAHRQGL